MCIRDRGQPVLVARIDGHVVGKLSRLQSDRYLSLVQAVDQPEVGCEGLVIAGSKGLEVTVRLPELT